MRTPCLVEGISLFLEGSESIGSPCEAQGRVEMGAPFFRKEQNASLSPRSVTAVLLESPGSLSSPLGAPELPCLWCMHSTFANCGQVSLAATTISSNDMPEFPRQAR